MIYFISYPKSGRTWCRTIIEEYARRTGATPKAHDWTHIGFGNVRKDRVDKGEMWRKDKYPKILIKRDPLDLLVSLYHDQIKRVTSVRKNYSNKSGRTIDDYVLEKSDSIIEFREKSRGLKYEYEFSYEKMIKQPGKTFLPVMEMLFGKVDDKVYREVIKFCHFDNLSKLERSGEIDMRGARDFYKTRKGKVGSHREELQKETISKLQKKFRK